MPGMLAWWGLLSLSGYDAHSTIDGVHGEEAFSLEILGLPGVASLDWYGKASWA